MGEWYADSKPEDSFGLICSVKRDGFCFDTSLAVKPYRRDLSALDFAVMEDDYSVMALARHIELPASDLTEIEVDQLIAFLHALTDKASTDLRSGVPARVPSGLTVFD